MRVRVPPRFSMTMTGPEGSYELICSPLNDDPWEGSVETAIAGVAMLWSIEHADNDDGFHLSGLTGGSEVVWSDVFWFELWPEASPPRIDYFGDRILWRSDLAITVSRVG